MTALQSVNQYRNKGLPFNIHYIPTQLWICPKDIYKAVYCHPAY